VKRDKVKRAGKPDEAPGGREWVSFPDPVENRTWMFDVGFLESNWTCIYGRGCIGVLTGPAAEWEQGCCSYGAHFTGDADAERVAAAASRLTGADWQFKQEARRRGGPLRRTREGDTATRLVDGACIFLNRPTFEGGAGCALHRAATERGERPLDWKPDVCWQLPLRREDAVADSGHVTSTVRAWTRGDWGRGGAAFHWWCTDSAEAFSGERPVYEELREELVAMVGSELYELVEAYLRRRRRHETPVELRRRKGKAAQVSPSAGSASSSSSDS
jgi:hypothetical protein